MTTCHSNEYDATDLRVGSVCVIDNSLADAVASVRHGMLIINIKYIAANELNSLISLIHTNLAVLSDKTNSNNLAYEN